MILIKAATRIAAAIADEKAALTFLTEIGFKGLRPKSSSDDMIKFWYTDYNKSTVKDYLGNPKPAESSLRYNFGKDGVVAIWPSKKTVILKNSKRGARDLPKVAPVPAPHVPEVKPEVPLSPAQSPNNPGSKENDNDSVPVTLVDAKVSTMYNYARATDNASYRLSFMKTLWRYLNTHKFQGQLNEPKFRLLKNVSGTSMRLRGRWWPGKKQLEVAPRLFNATQNFFIEIFLHEMCHQAVTEVDQREEDVNKGHGPRWERWMRHVHLNPLRYDPNDNDTYMTQEEKAKRDIERDENLQRRIRSIETVKQTGLTKMQPRSALPASIVINGQVINGLIICPAVQNGSKWAFLSINYFNNFLTTKRLTWQAVRKEQFFVFNGGERSQFNTTGWLQVSEAIKKDYSTKQLVRKSRRGYGIGY